MERLTTKNADGSYAPLPGMQERAMQRLGCWADMAEQLEQEQTAVAAELEALRGRGKEKSVRFRELFARKPVSYTHLDVYKRQSRRWRSVP